MHFCCKFRIQNATATATRRGSIQLPIGSCKTQNVAFSLFFFFIQPSASARQASGEKRIEVIGEVAAAAAVVVAGVAAVDAVAVAV